MKADSLIAKLTAYYGPAKKYSDEHIGALTRFASDIDEEGIDRVFDWIVENRESMAACGVKDLKQACIALGIGFRNLVFADAYRIKCAACGFDYLYLPTVSIQQQLEFNQHCRCPQCGMFGSDQIVAGEYARMRGGKFPDWYERTCERLRNHDWKGEKETELTTFWQPARVRKEMAEERMQTIDAEVKEAARGKSWGSHG